MDSIQKKSLPDISDHARWRLLLTVGESCVRAVFHDQAAKRQLLYLDRNWHCDPADALGRIEDAIYEDPAILDDYITGILVRPTRMILVPSAEIDPGDEEAAADMLSLLDLSENKDVWIEPVEASLTAVFSTPAGVKDFLLRSFPTEDVHFALRPMLAYLLSGQTPVAERVWVHFDERTLDIVAMAGGMPVLVNTRAYNDPADAAYYIIMAMRALSLSESDAEVMLSGSAVVRREIMPVLRKYLGFVANGILPIHVKRALEQGLSLTEALQINTTCL